MALGYAKGEDRREEAGERGGRGGSGDEGRDEEMKIVFY